MTSQILGGTLSELRAMTKRWHLVHDGDHVQCVRCILSASCENQESCLLVNILEPVQDKREPKMDRMMLLICGSSGFADDVLAFAL